MWGFILAWCWLRFFDCKSIDGGTPGRISRVWKDPRRKQRVRRKPRLGTWVFFLSETKLHNNSEDDGYFSAVIKCIFWAFILLVWGVPRDPWQSMWLHQRQADAAFHIKIEIFHVTMQYLETLEERLNNDYFHQVTNRGITPNLDEGNKNSNPGFVFSVAENQTWANKRVQITANDRNMDEVPWAETSIIVHSVWTGRLEPSQGRSWILSFFFWRIRIKNPSLCRRNYSIPKFWSR